MTYPVQGGPAIPVYITGGGTADGATEVTLQQLLARLPASLDATGALKVSGGSATRAAGVAHRAGIAAADTLAIPTLAGANLADNGDGTGSLVASTTYYVATTARNAFGCTPAQTSIASKATGAGANTKSIRVTQAQVTGAIGYDVFLSVDTAPKWVGYITEAQRAAGDCEITAVGTVVTGSGAPAGTFDINVVGTGIQTSNAVLANNNAFTPTNAGIVAIDTTGYSKAYVHVKLALTDIRTAPTLNLIPFFLSQAADSTWYAGTLLQLSPLGQAGTPLEQVFALNVDGAAGLKLLIANITGQGAGASVWIELV